jgi:hypothetical protein
MWWTNALEFMQISICYVLFAALFVGADSISEHLLGSELLHNSYQAFAIIKSGHFPHERFNICKSRHCLLAFVHF